MNYHQLLINHINDKVSLSKSEEDLIKKHFMLKEFKKNELLLSEGEVSKYNRFIVEGCLKTYTIDSDGKEHIVHIGIENWWINDLQSYFTQEPARQYIQAVEKGKILQIEKEKLEMIFDISQTIERFFRIIFQNAYVAVIDRTLNAISKSAEERYNEFCKNYKAIEQRVPQYVLASYLGITPEFLSLLRKKKK